MPPSAPPTSGASQNSHSWPSAQPPANSAGPVLRAGLTEVLVTGIQIRWISVSARPIAIGAKPAGARRSRRAHDDEQEHHRQHDLGEKAAAMAHSAPGECVAIAVGRESVGGVEVRRCRWR